jgi:hypothetical protein
VFTYRACAGEMGILALCEGLWASYTMCRGWGWGEGGGQGELVAGTQHEPVARTPASFQRTQLNEIFS